MLPEEIINLILKASNYGEIFGDGTLISSLYRKYSFVIHPDKCGLPNAKEAFQRLVLLEGEATKAFAAGTYSASKRIKELASVSLGGSTYQPIDIVHGTVATILVCENEVIKIPNTPKDNDLMLNEGRVLQKVWETPDMCKGFFPQLIKTGEVKYKGNRQVNILERIKGVSLKQVHEAFPKGVELCHAAWMFNRILASLVIIHHSGFVHNGLTLSNFIIEPETHRGVLIDFTNSVAIGRPAKSITSDKDAHPAEVFSKKPLVPATDLFMAARLMRTLLGKTPISRRIDALLNACSLVNGRLNDAREVLISFKEALLPIFGQPKFVEFKMP